MPTPINKIEEEMREKFLLGYSAFRNIDEVADWWLSKVKESYLSGIKDAIGALPEEKDTKTGRENGYCRCGISYYECDCGGFNQCLAEAKSSLTTLLEDNNKNK